MRVLFVSSPGIGHVFPMVPLAWALRASGHDVLVLTAGPALAVERAGLPVIDVAPDWGRERIPARLLAEHPDLAERLRCLRTEKISDLQRTAELLATTSGFFVDPVLEVATRWRPDLLVQSQVQGAGFVVAGKLGIPLVEHGFGFVRTTGWADLCRERMAGFFDRHGVTALPERRAFVDIAPASMVDAGQGWPMRCVPYNGGGVLPEWAWRDTDRDRPRIAVTAGTSEPAHGGLPTVERVLEAAAGVDAEFVFALGDTDPSALGPLPRNVRAAGWVPLNHLLTTCAAIVHHGGAGTTLTALDAGVPQLVLPSGTDRHINAAAVHKRGVGVSVEDGPVSTDVFDTLLHDAAVKGTAAEVRAEMHAMPTASDLLLRLVDLVEG